MGSSNRDSKAQSGRLLSNSLRMELDHGGDSVSKAAAVFSGGRRPVPELWVCGEGVENWSETEWLWRGRG